jgi:hypothetical protein
MRTRDPLPSTLRSIADADVIEGFPTSNFGDAPTMWVGYHKGACTDSNTSRGVSRSLIRFDTSTIPPGAPIAQAILHVELVGACWMTVNTGQARLVTAHRIAGDWSETAVTWPAQPALAEPYGSVAIPLNSGVLNWYAIDVTDLVRGWVNGSAPNYGLALRGLESAGSDFVWMSFATRQWLGGEPYLAITYAGAQQIQEAPAAAEPPSAATCVPAGQEMVMCATSDGSTQAR